MYLCRENKGADKQVSHDAAQLRTFTKFKTCNATISNGQIWLR